MKFISLNGYVEDSFYISLRIEGGNNDDCYSDTFWISPEGNELQVSDNILNTEFDYILELFYSLNDCIAFQGAMRRMGVYFD